MLETSAFESLYSGQFTLSTLLKKTNIHNGTMIATVCFLELNLEVCVVNKLII